MYALVLGFVEKPFDPALLLDSVREAWQRVVANQERTALIADIEARRATLTSREAGILGLLVEAYPNRMIAARLGMSIRTVEHHRAHIMERTGARSLSHLISWCSRVAGFVQTDEEPRGHRSVEPTIVGSEHFPR